jgi:endonuclease/exonuclease/phosphatase family metal-dependent hydrolase
MNNDNVSILEEQSDQLSSESSSSEALSTKNRVSILNHKLNSYFPELAKFNSTKEMENSSLYASIKPEVERVLNCVHQEDLAPTQEHNISHSRASIKTLAWNIERGNRLSGIIKALKEHPLMKDSDIYMLTELDYGMARSKNRFIAREIAERLGLNYAFAPCYIALNKGSGLESDVEGENTLALHGNALLSRYPLTGVHSIALPNGKDKMKGKEKRLGSQRAVIADVHHPAGLIRAVSLHLDAHSTQTHRYQQMKLLLDHLDQLNPSLPVIIGGDWNTSTYNSKRAVYSILGYVRRVLMGVHNVINNHYPYPDRWFERKLFRELERRGYNYKDFNELGIGTLHYCVEDIAVNVNMADWIPQWCFWFINWALQKNGGRCSLKLDWFAGKGISPIPNSPPAVIGNLRDANGPLSDHDAILINYQLSSVSYQQ